MFFFFLGPKLPFKLSNFTMVSSPTDRVVIAVGGLLEGEYSWQQPCSNGLFELSGDTIDTLKGTLLKQRLQYSRMMHLSFPITPHRCQLNFPKNMKGCPNHVDSIGDFFQLVVLSFRLTTNLPLSLILPT